jgi:hypothetical protein
MTNRTPLFLALIGLLYVVTGCATTKGFVKNPERLKSIQKVAVLPFTSYNAEVGFAIAESLSANLVASRFIVVERIQLEKILAEQGLTLTGVLENQQSIIGKLKGVDAVIVGTATVSRGFAGMLFGGYIDYVSNCTARMIEVSTGEIIVAATFTATTASTQRGVTTAAEVGQLLSEKIIASERSGGRPLRGQKQQDLLDSREKPPSFSSTSFEGWHMLSAGKLNNVMIEKRTSSEILISYPSGIMKGTSTDGVMYNGEWHGKVNWGRWEIRFDSQDEATGWSDNKGIGEKFPMKLRKKD